MGMFNCIKQCRLCVKYVRCQLPVRKYRQRLENGLQDRGRRFDNHCCLLFERSVFGYSTYSADNLARSIETTVNILKGRRGENGKASKLHQAV